MAYVRKKKTYCLDWAEGPFKGLEVKVSSLPIGRFLEIAPKIDGLGGEITPEVVGMLMPALQELADAILGWNIEDEDEAGNTTPVPATLDGLLTLEPGEMTAILQAWISAGTQVPGPLEQRSPNGSPEDLRSTEEFLASLPTSSVPA